MILPLLVFSLSALLLTSALDYEEVVKEEWKAWKARHGKHYDPAEDKFRMKVFMENKHKIAIHNRLYGEGLRRYRLDMNEFGDLLHHEFTSLLNGFKMTDIEKVTANTPLYLSPASVVIPEEIDWREKGYVTPVKNQGQCGSCWAFSATGSLEGQHFRKTGELISLSEQNLVDCSQKYGNGGCHGGSQYYAFNYVRDNSGINSEMLYPYEEKDGECRFNETAVAATDNGVVHLPPDEEKLKEAVATVGPIAVTIHAGESSFQFYHEGIYDNPDCNDKPLDHAVLLVGYGSEEGKPYWIVKNSWGSYWGEKGYIRLYRNNTNQCRIKDVTFYPLV